MLSASWPSIVGLLPVVRRSRSPPPAMISPWLGGGFKSEGAGYSCVGSSPTAISQAELPARVARDSLGWLVPGKLRGNSSASSVAHRRIGGYGVGRECFR